MLELAAGTGIVTAAIRPALPDDVQLTATDLSDAMLDVARAKTTDNDATVFQSADAMALPFDDGAFDVIACQFGVMFFPDKIDSYREARRLLAPGGCYFMSAWDSLDRNSFARVADDTAVGLAHVG